MTERRGGSDVGQGTETVAVQQVRHSMLGQVQYSYSIHTKIVPCEKNVLR